VNAQLRNLDRKAKGKWEWKNKNAPILANAALFHCAVLAYIPALDAIMMAARRFDNGNPNSKDYLVGSGQVITGNRNDA